jgi:hypothetical protein
MDKYEYHFDSIDEFYNAAQRPAPKLLKDWKNNFNRDEPRFFGANRADILTGLKYNYPEAIRVVETLPNMTGQTQQASTVRTWHTDDGDDGDQERYLMELPHMIRRKKVLRHGQRAVCKIIVSVCEGCNVKAENLLYKTYAACRIVDQLEAAGTRCEIIAYDHHIECEESTGKRYKCFVTVKRADDPINLGLIATALSPWFFRFWCFNHIYTVMSPTPSLGHVGGLETKDHDPEDITIQQGECLSLETAERKIKSLDINQ